MFEIRADNVQMRGRACLVGKGVLVITMVRGKGGCKLVPCNIWFFLGGGGGGRGNRSRNII